MTHAIGRRRLLTTAGAAVASVALANIADASIPIHGRPTVNGVILQLGPSSIELNTPRGRREVSFDSTATFQRDNQVAKLSDFMRGDRVVAELSSPDAPHIASRMESRYRLVEGRVTRIRDERMFLTTRVVWLARDTVVHTSGNRDPLPHSALHAGMHVGITALYDPVSSRLVARDIEIERY